MACRTALLLLSLAACAAPGGAPWRDAPDAAFVHAVAAWPLAAPAAPWAGLADSAPQWRALVAQPALAAVPLASERVAFAVERAVVVVLPGALAAPVVVAVGTEEGVDVLTLQATPAAGAHGLAVLLTVAAAPGQLAVVSALPTADGAWHESTLLVAPGR